ACRQLIDRAAGYGIEGIQGDGNDILAVMDCVAKARSQVLESGKPLIIEALTFRKRGHEEASGTAYVPSELMAEWALKDPIARFTDLVLEKGLLTTDELRVIKKNAEKLYSSDIERALISPVPSPNNEEHLDRVY